MSIKYQIIDTEDGSHTLKVVDTEMTFHSTKGAIQESDHIFIKSGLEYFIQKHPSKKTISILEIGFGTGLNALLTAISAARFSKNVVYYAIELNPLPAEIYSKLNYPQILKQPELYKTIMQTGWNQLLYITSFFKLHKINADLVQHVFTNQFDIIYYDAFAPEDQSEMWDDTICEKMFGALNKEGVLTTYCSKSVIRKAMHRAGFLVEKLPGPPGKREILRAVKSIVN